MFVIGCGRDQWKLVNFELQFWNLNVFPTFLCKISVCSFLIVTKDPNKIVRSLILTMLFT